MWQETLAGNCKGVERRAGWLRNACSVIQRWRIAGRAVKRWGMSAVLRGKPCTVRRLPRARCPTWARTPARTAASDVCMACTAAADARRRLRGEKNRATSAATATASSRSGVVLGNVVIDMSSRVGLTENGILRVSS